MTWPFDIGGASEEQRQLFAKLFRYLMVFGGAMLVALAVTPLVRALARRLKIGMTGIPDARHIHVTPTPRGGGLAVFIAFHLAVFGVVWVTAGDVCPDYSNAQFYNFLGASALLAAVGLMDDVFNLKPWLKLAGQIAVATILYLGGAHFSAFFTSNFPDWANYVLTVFWIVGAINAFNLIDGMDGLAAGLAMIAALGLAGSMFFRGKAEAAIPFLALAGASLGFLRYNFHPASIFLGDTGSMFLGLTLATFPLMSATKTELVASIGVPLMVMGIPIFDTAIAIWRRSARALVPDAGLGKRLGRLGVMQGDKEHVHHRLLARFVNQRRVALIFYSVNAGLVVVGMAAMLLQDRASGLFLVAFVAGAFVVVRHLTKVELWETGRALVLAQPDRLSHRLIVPVYLAVDLAGLCGAWYLARWLARMPLAAHEVKISLPLFVGPVFVMLVLARTYTRVWSRALLREYALAGLAIVAGCLLAGGVVILSGADQEPGWRRAAIMFGLLAQVPILGFRLMNETLRETVSVIERLTLVERGDTVRLLAYGGGDRFRLFLRERRSQTGHHDSVVIGVLDDDSNLRGRLVMGYNVLGSLDDLPEVLREHRINRIVLTTTLPADRRERLIAVAREAGVPASEWTITEKTLV